MKKRLIAAGLMLAMFTGSAYAVSSYQKTINVEYGVSLSINGQTPTLTDVNGKTVQPFVYEGTTYVPIRAVGENLGKVVEYNADSNTASITNAATDFSQKSNANIVYSQCDLSHRIHEETIMLYALLNADISDKTAESYMSQYEDLLEAANSSANLASAMKLNDTDGKNSKYILALEGIKPQFENYQKAFTSFFNYKAGNGQESLNMSNYVQAEAQTWWTAQSYCSDAALEFIK